MCLRCVHAPPNGKRITKIKQLGSEMGQRRTSPKVLILVRLSPIQDMRRSLRRHWKSSKPSAQFDPGWCTLLECTSQKNSVLPALPCASRKERVRLLNLAKGFCKSL